jgi:argininosuccinate lyase
VVATDLAEALARAGTPFHQAHQIVGRFVLESVRSGKKPADWTAERCARSRPSSRRDGALLDPREGCAIARDSRRHRPEAWPRRWRSARERLKEMRIMSKTYRQGQILK